MKKKIQETRIGVEGYTAIVRDGELDSIDNIKHEGSFRMPTVEELRAYIQFLQEVIEAMEED